MRKEQVLLLLKRNREWPSNKNSYDKRKGRQRNYNWVITSIYEENEGYITLQFHPSLKYLFLELKEKFTSYQLENVVRLNSVYSIRIYELLKQYERLRKRELTLEELRHF
ncbi:replication initiation protein [Bacillus megaterium]|nr:replication initiation protein [Priestia megaterium]